MNITIPRQLKFLIALIGMMLGSAGMQNSQAQVLMSLIFGDKLNTENNYFGLHLDQSFNSMSNPESHKSFRTFNMGLFFSHKLDEHWMINFDMLAKYRRGVKGLDTYSLGDEALDEVSSEAEVSRSINYLSVPITMRYYASRSIFLEAGPQLSMRLGARDVFEISNDKDQGTYKNDIRDQVNKWDTGVVLGAGMMIGKDKVNALGLRYHGGFSDVMPDFSEKQKHNTWAIYANLPIGRGKMKSSN